VSACVRARVLFARYPTNQCTEHHQILVAGVVEATDKLTRI